MSEVATKPGKPTARNGEVGAERVLIIMDVPNIMGSAKVAAQYEPKARFSFENIVREIRKSGTRPRYIVEMHAVALMSDDGTFQRRVQARLQNVGFHVATVVQKHPERRVEPCSHHQVCADCGWGTARSVEEGAVDLELTNIVWARVSAQFRMGTPLDTVVLVAGDGDYFGMVHRLREVGLRVEVYGPDHATAGRLKSIADKHVLMNQHGPEGSKREDRFMFVGDEISRIGGSRSESLVELEEPSFDAVDYVRTNG